MPQLTIMIVMYIELCSYMPCRGCGSVWEAANRCITQIATIPRTNHVDLE